MFNIRVYGILIEAGHLLVTDEYRLGMMMTKFPGGGLEYGEGLKDCLIREWKEETGFDIRILSHYYTTDFFQPSYKLPESRQIINVYYFVEAIEQYPLRTTEKRFDFEQLVDGIQTFRWIPIHLVSPSEFTLPIDKVVASMLANEFDRH